MTTTKEPRPLRDVSAVGDVVEHETSLDLNVQFRGTIGEQDLPPFDFFNRQRRKYRETVLAVDKQNRPTTIRRVYSIARNVRNGLDGEIDQTVSSLQGKTVTLRRDPQGKRIVTVAKGSITAEDREALLRELAAYGEAFFPDRELAPGDEWTSDSQLYRRLFNAENMVVKGKFLDVVTFQGHRCAQVGITLEMVAKVPNTPMTMTMALKGDLYHALDLQRTLSVSLSGPVTAKGQPREQGVVGNISGDGLGELKTTSRWLKVGGKAVSPAKK